MRTPALQVALLALKRSVRREKRRVKADPFESGTWLLDMAVL